MSQGKVRRGGVVGLITSTYTLDEQSGDIRDLLAGTADLLQAVRFGGLRDLQAKYEPDFYDKTWSVRDQANRRVLRPRTRRSF